MAKAAFLKETEKQIIREAYLRERHAPAPSLLKAVNADKRMTRELSLSTIQREKTELVKFYGRMAASPESQPWHVGRCAEHPFTAEAIARILDIQSWLRSRGESDVVTMGEAIWVERFHVALKDNDDLWIAVQLYRRRELFKDLERQSHSSGFLDTRELDRLLRPGMRQRLQSDEHWWDHPQETQGPAAVSDLLWSYDHIKRSRRTLSSEEERLFQTSLRQIMEPMVGWESKRVLGSPLTLAEVRWLLELAVKDGDK